MRIKNIFLTVSLLLVISAGVTASELPQPTGLVNDFANVITPEYKEKINRIIDELEQKTTAQIAIVTVSSIAPYDEKEYARMIFDSWKPGQKGKDNGVLILLAIKEKLWRIETGYGVEEILPDGLCGQIGRDFMVPFFKNGNYSAGLYSGTSEIARIIANHNKAYLQNNPPSSKPIGNIPLNIFMGIFALFFFYLWNIPWPIFIGLPATLLFGSLFFMQSPILGMLVAIGYCASMVTRYFIWKKTPLEKRVPLWKVFVFGLMVLGNSNNRTGRNTWSGGGFGGRSGGGGGGGFGGGSGGGGGAGGRF